MANAKAKVRGPLEAAFKACSRHFWAAGVFSALLNILYLTPTLYMLQVYDRVVPTRGVSTLALLTLVFLFSVATLALLDFVRARLLVRASIRLDRQLSVPILSSLLSRNNSMQPQRSSQALREFDTLRQALTGAGILALFDAPWTPIYIAICFLLHPLLGAIALFGSLSLLALAFFNERVTRVPIQRANEAASISYYSIDHSAQASGTIRALGMRSAMVVRHMRERYASIHLQSEASFGGSTFMSMTKFMRLSLQSIALGAGAFLAIENQISAGAIFAASLLVTRALSPIEQVLGGWKDGVRARAAWRSLQQLFEEAEKDTPHTLLPAPSGKLQVERVSVVAPSRQRLILSNVNFSLQAGECLGVVGPSGAGKSTLMKVIAGALVPREGSVRFGGADSKDWDEDQLAKYVGYVPQDPTLFKGTVKENIARFQGYVEADQAIVDEAVVRAATACGAHDFVLRLPNGYDTELEWGGAGLSAGQAQRIALARAFYGEPRFIIMDEPNAHLDSAGEADLLEAIFKLRQEGVIIIIVAHRTGILAAADKILILNEGKVEMMGPREDVTQRIAASRAQSETEAKPQAEPGQS